MTAKKSDPPLATYAKKRDFTKTPEPSGAAKASQAVAQPLARTDERRRFVVQMHHASRLHYDFRLESDGVLKSWAIPKGPSFDPRDKRLAMAVEDHPFDYRDFEGIIPKGNYGAGEVIVWDRGTYRLLEGTSTTEQIARGSVKIEMFGEKLRGGFALVHIKGRGGEVNAWLLVKERDDAVDPAWRVDDHAQSVKSGKTLADLAVDPQAPHWTSSRPASSAAATSSAAASAAAPATAAGAPKGARVPGGKGARVPAGKGAPMPDVASPMLATPVERPFDDPDWLFELKWDGYRALARIEPDGTVSIASRNGKDFTQKFPELGDIAAAFSEWPIIIDGEIVVLDDEGRPSFGALQERLDRFGRTKPQERPVTFVVFDLLYRKGRDLREQPLETRKATLEALLTGRGSVMYSKHVLGAGTEFFAAAAGRGLEGIVGKRRASTYQTSRSRDWVKIKAQMRAEFVIGGWTEGRGSRKHFGALLVGTYEGDEFVYAGSVGTGFDTKKLAAISKQLAPLERKTSPFKVKPKTDSPAHFVTPALVAEVSFTEWTRDGLLRHPVYVAMRVDKEPREVVRDVASSVA